jgi:hypothetical protein
VTTLDDALRQALEENGLDESYRPDVRELLETPRDQWPPCCGSLCDPCILVLWRTADRVRQLCPGLEGRPGNR